MNEVTERSNLIVTTTPSARPLLFADAIQKGTHITAMGSDTPGKQELHAGVAGMADLVVADSIGFALVPFWYVTSNEGRESLRELIKPRRVAAIHVGQGQAEDFFKKIESALSGTIVFRKMLEEKIVKLTDEP